MDNCKVGIDSCKAGRLTIVESLPICRKTKHPLNGLAVMRIPVHIHGESAGYIDLVIACGGHSGPQNMQCAQGQNPDPICLACSPLTVAPFLNT